MARGRPVRRQPGRRRHRPADHRQPRHAPVPRRSRTDRLPGAQDRHLAVDHRRHRGGRGHLRAHKPAAAPGGRQVRDAGQRAADEGDGAVRPHWSSTRSRACARSCSPRSPSRTSSSKPRSCSPGTTNRCWLRRSSSASSASSPTTTSPRSPGYVPLSATVPNSCSPSVTAGSSAARPGRGGDATGNRPNSKRPRAPPAFAPTGRPRPGNPTGCAGRRPGAAVRPCAPVRRQRGPDTSPEHERPAVSSGPRHIYLRYTSHWSTTESRRSALKCTWHVPVLNVTGAALTGRSRPNPQGRGLPAARVSLTRPNRFSGSA